MKPSPEIAIIDANTLTCMGLRGLIERMMPMATVRTFNSFEQLVRDTPDMYFHYFISAQTLLEHSAFFIERKEKTIVLTNGTAGTPQTSHFHTLISIKAKTAWYVLCYNCNSTRTHMADTSRKICPALI